MSKAKELKMIDFNEVAQQVWTCKNPNCSNRLVLTKRTEFFRYPITCAKCSEITNEYIKNYKMSLKNYYEVKLR